MRRALHGEGGKAADVPGVLSAQGQGRGLTADCGCGRLPALPRFAVCTGSGRWRRMDLYRKALPVRLPGAAFRLRSVLGVQLSGWKGFAVEALHGRL